MAKKQFYIILGVEENATLTDITRAYRAKALMYHPDKNGGVDLDDRYAKVQSAYDTLSDPVKRALYDKGELADDDNNLLDNPEGLERPSAEYKRYLESVREAYSNITLTRFSDENKKEVLDKASPQQSSFFSSDYYGKLYTFTYSNANGNDVDEVFDNVYALIAKKTEINPEGPETPTFLNEKLNITILFDILNQFIRGKYYGKLLTAIQDYLESELKKRGVSYESICLGKIVLQLIRLTDIKAQHSVAMEILHQLFDSQYQKHEAAKRQLDLLLKDFKDNLLEYEKSSEEFEKARLSMSNAKKLDDYLKAKLQNIENKLDANKERFTKIYSALTRVLYMTSPNHKIQEKLESELELLERERHTLDLGRKIALEQSEKVSLHYQSCVAKFELEEKRFKEISETKHEYEQQKLKIETNCIHPEFINIIESKYFKKLTAQIVHHYWLDQTPVVNPERLKKTAYAIEILRNQSSAFLDILLHAESTLGKLTQSDLKYDDYFNIAYYFIDLAQTMSSGDIKANASVAAGLSFQLASQVCTNEVDKISCEILALTVYQSAMTMAARLPLSNALYLSIHITKYLAEFTYNVTTMTQQDNNKIAAELGHIGDTISASLYPKLSISHGSNIDSMQAAADRAMYVISSFPSFSQPTRFIDQSSRQNFYRSLENTMINRFSERMKNADFDPNEGSASERAEQYYKRYVNMLGSDDASPHEILEARLVAMKALLLQSNTSIFEMNKYLNAPFISIPQNAEGFFEPGALLFPESEEDIEDIIYKSFVGFVIKEGGGLEILAERWINGDNPSDKLFTHRQILELMKGGVNHAIFSLDENNPYHSLDPIQIMRFSPDALEDTEYLRCLLHCDEILKMMTQDRLIRSIPPYDTTDMSALLQGLDDDIKNELLTYAHKQRHNAKSKATRFWIQLGEIPRYCSETDEFDIIEYGEPGVIVKKQAMQIGVSGQLEDAPVDANDNSDEAKFAAAMTKHYDKLAEILPVFKQLKEFFKITAAVHELQTRRVKNQTNRELKMARLENEAGWKAFAEEKRKEWTENLKSNQYWEELLKNRINELNRNVNDDEFWARETRHLFKIMVQERDLYADENNEAHHSQRLEYAERMKSAFYKKQITTQPMPSKSQLKQSCASMREFIEKNAYKRLKNKWMSGDISDFARAKIDFELEKEFASGAMPNEITDLLQIQKDEVAKQQKEILEKHDAEYGPYIKLVIGEKDIIRFSKPVYTATDNEFLIFHHAERSNYKADLINRRISSDKIPSLLEKYYPVHTHLKTFNTLVAEKRKRAADNISNFLVNHGYNVLEYFDNDNDKLQHAINAAVDGNREDLTKAMTESQMAKIMTSLFNPSVKKTAEIEKILQKLRGKKMIRVMAEMHSLSKSKIFPDFSYLKRYLVSNAFDEAIDKLAEGDYLLFMEAHIIIRAEWLQKEYSGDLFARAKEQKAKRREELRANVQSEAKHYVDTMKENIQNNLEGNIIALIEHEKEMIRGELMECDAFESAVLSIGLGKIPKLNAEPNTKHRVPSITTKVDNDHIITGGVNATPSFRDMGPSKYLERQRVKTELANVTSDLFSATHFTTPLSLDRARAAIRNAQFTDASSDFSVSLQIRQVERTIQAVECVQGLERDRQRFRELHSQSQSTKYKTPTTSKKWKDIETQNIKQSTINYISQFAGGSNNGSSDSNNNSNDSKKALVLWRFMHPSPRAAAAIATGVVIATANAEAKIAATNASTDNKTYTISAAAPNNDLHTAIDASNARAAETNRQHILANQAINRMQNSSPIRKSVLFNPRHDDYSDKRKSQTFSVVIPKESTAVKINYLYRGAAQPTDEIFPEGFKSEHFNKGRSAPSSNTGASIKYNISTSTSRNIAKQYPDPDHENTKVERSSVYKINPQLRGIVLKNSLLSEVVVPDFIEPKDIAGAWKVNITITSAITHKQLIENGFGYIPEGYPITDKIFYEDTRRLGKFTPNPNYEPPLVVQAAEGVKYLGYGLTLMAAGLDAINFAKAAHESITTHDLTPVVHETVRIETSWNAAIRLGASSAELGRWICKPFGLWSFACAAAGGAVGSAIGYMSASEAVNAGFKENEIEPEKHFEVKSAEFPGDLSQTHKRITLLFDIKNYNGGFENNSQDTKSTEYFVYERHDHVQKKYLK